MREAAWHDHKIDRAVAYHLVGDIAFPFA
jgi:hypothetical protein